MLVRAVVWAAYFYYVDDVRISRPQGYNPVRFFGLACVSVRLRTALWPAFSHPGRYFFNNHPNPQVRMDSRWAG